MQNNLDILIKKSYSQFKKDSRIKECFHYEKESCSNKIILAHSLQKNRVLNLIESIVDGNSTVYSFLRRRYSANGLPNGFEPIGKNEASTFFGFCGYHDNLIFNPIENNPINLNNDEHCFLLSYRAFAKDYHAKYESIKGYKNNKHIQADIREEMINGSEIGLRDAELTKKRLNEILKLKEYNQLEIFTYKLDYIIPIALAASITPEYTYWNEKLNKTINPDIIYEYVNFVIQPMENGETLILLTCLPEHKKSVRFIDQLDSLQEIPLLKAICSIAINNVENTFFSPEIWNILSKNERTQLLHELEITNPVVRLKYNKFFHSKLNLFERRFEKFIDYDKN